MLNITATNLHRFMNCNGSIQMAGFIADQEDKDTTVRDEGNAVHWLVQQVHTSEFTAEELIDRKAYNGVYITVEMVDHLDEYLKATVGAEIEIETSFAGSGYQINGRADSIKYFPNEGRLKVDDLKYGWALVDPEMNWTLIAHAIGWWISNPDKPIGIIDFSVYQPRPYHAAGRVRTWTIDVNKLNELYQAINTALLQPVNELRTGSHCTRCPARTTCPAANAADMNAIDTSTALFEDDLTNDDLSLKLDQYSRAIKVLTEGQKALNELAEHRVKEGQIVNNYGLVAEMTNAKWNDGVTAELVEAMSGVVISKSSLVTPGQAKKLGVAEELVTSLSKKHQKGVKLVRMSANQRAKKLFGKD